MLALVGLAACGGDEASSTTSTTVAPTSTTIPGSSTTIDGSTTTTSTTSTTTTTLGPVELFVDAADGTTFLDATVGDMVRLVVTADTTDEVHLHGYDLLADVTPDTEAVIEFVADQAGVFEIELESAGRRIAELAVNP